METPQVQDPKAAIPLPEERPWLRVEEAGRLGFGLGRASSYEAVRRGDIPSIRIGRRVLVPTAALRRMLELDADPRSVA